MEWVAGLNSAAAAQTFADYCQSRGLTVSVVVHHAQQADLYADSQQLSAVHAELAAFLAEPQAGRYNAAAWQLGQVDQRVGSSAAFDGFWQRLRQQTGPVTLLLTTACLLVFVLLQIFPQTVFDSLRLQEEQTLLSLRWWTPVLLHFSSAHLMFNLLAWLIYGGRLEQRLGSWYLALLVVLIGLLSNVLQALLSGPYFGGLSGVVYGVFGFVWVYGWRFPQSGLGLSKVDLTLALGFMALGFADMLWVNTANWAHLAGFISGAVLALVKQKTR